MKNETSLPKTAKLSTEHSLADLIGPISSQRTMHMIYCPISVYADNIMLVVQTYPDRFPLHSCLPDLSNDPNNEKYVSLLGLVGKLSGGDTDGVTLLMRRDFNTRISDPNEYFNVYDSEQGLMIRLIHALDRDVSMELGIADY